MHVHHDGLEVRTHGKGLYEITDDAQSKIDKCGMRNGTVTVFVQHTSCSIVIMENADPTARRDLEEFFDRLVPENADYFTHDAEGSDDMPSHIRMVLTRTSETVLNCGRKNAARHLARDFPVRTPPRTASAKSPYHHDRRMIVVTRAVCSATL